MSVHAVSAIARRRTTKDSLLDVAAQVLLNDAAASLAEIAEAAGIGRTTLHKHYAARDDLLRAVGHRMVDVWEQAVTELAGAPDGGLRSFTAAMIPYGPQLAFLWRTPILDRDEEINRRWATVEARVLQVLTRAQEHGVIAPAVPHWWLLRIFYAAIYAAAESVSIGRLAPQDAPDLALDTFLHGLAAHRDRDEKNS